LSGQDNFFDSKFRGEIDERDLRIFKIKKLLYENSSSIKKCRKI